MTIIITTKIIGASLSEPHTYQILSYQGRTVVSPGVSWRPIFAVKGGKEENKGEKKRGRGGGTKGPIGEERTTPKLKRAETYRAWPSLSASYISAGCART